MRILASVALLGMIFSAFAPSAKAKSREASDQNTRLLQVTKQVGQAEQKIQTEISNKENSNSENVKSLNDNFVAPVYIAEISQKARFANLTRLSKNASSYSLPRGDFVMNASAYTAAADECGKSDGITASGNKVSQGRTLACPPGYKFGTKVEIDGMGTYVCEDRGGAIKGNHFDIYMETKSQAFAFGRRNLIARVVN